MAQLGTETQEGDTEHDNDECHNEYIDLQVWKKFHIAVFVRASKIITSKKPYWQISIACTATGLILATRD